jgi:hypothetical protein
MKLIKVEEAVEKVLRENPETRSDDFMLIYCTYEELGYVKGMQSFATTLKKAKKRGYTSFESITRARRKLQNIYPELIDEITKKARTEKISDYVEYARS